MSYFLGLLLALVVPLAAACPPLAPDSAATLSLPAALARVNACHPEVRAAAGALDIAAAEALTAGQRANPQLTLGLASLNREALRGSNWNDKPFDRQIGIEQLIERGNKPALRHAGAQSLRQAALADVAEARRQARLATIRSYVDLAAAQARQRETLATVAMNEHAQKAFDSRVRAGDAAPLDATRFSLDAARVQADLRQAEADVSAMRLEFSRLIGAEEQAQELVADIDSLPGTAPPSDSAAPIEQRADLIAARARMQAAEHARDLARAQRTRDVTVGVQFSRYPSTPTNNAGTGNTVSVNLSVPLFLRHAYEGEIARAEAELAAAQEGLRRTRLAAQAEVARALADWRAADARWQLVSEQLVPAAEHVTAGAELAYRRGATGVLDVLDARRSLRAAQLERINAQAERAKAAAVLTSNLQPPEAVAAP